MAERQFVVFRLNDEIYGADIQFVGGITEYTSITKLPNAPEFVEGVIDLRGSIVPIMDLKKRFRLKESEVGANTRIILYQIEGKDIGFVVDEASQVVKIDEDDIEAKIEVVKGLKQEYLQGIGKVDGKIIILLNLEAILTEEETKEVVDIDLA